MKLIKKSKWYLVVGLVFVILLVCFILFDVQDKDFYKRIFNWYYEEQKQYRKSMIEAKKSEEVDNQKKIEDINRELQSVEGKKKKAINEVEQMDTVKVGEMFKKMGY